MKCAICEAELPSSRKDNPFHPFCSKRCKLVDLGNWFGGDYRVPGPPVPPWAVGPDGSDDEPGW